MGLNIEMFKIIGHALEMVTFILKHERKCQNYRHPLPLKLKEKMKETCRACANSDKTEHVASNGK